MGAGILVPIESNRSAKIGSIDLGQDGISYVKKALKEGGPLSPLVASLFDDQGTSFAALEDGTDLTRAKKFTVGTFMPTAAIRKWLADYVASKWGVNTQLVFGDPWAKPSDAANRRRQPYYFLGDQTPYYVPQGKDLYTLLTEGQKQPITRNFPIFVINPPVLLPQPGQQATHVQLDQLAQNTRAVLASAYDHEGYVVWQK
jgi:hypothetical protein